MKKVVNEPGSLFLVEYTDRIDETELNWGFRVGYNKEEKIPVLFIFSNFPHSVKTNRQSLVGSIRTHVEERKGIIFFYTAMKDDVKKFVHEALRKERVEMNFLTYSDDRYTSEYFSRIVETCFSIKREDIKISEIKIMKKEEIMDVTTLVKSIPGSLGYLLIKEGKLEETKNISLETDKLNMFVTANRLSSVLLNNFPGIHRVLMEKKVGPITLHDKAGGKIILIKHLKDNKGKWDLVFVGTESELEAIKNSVS